MEQGNVFRLVAVKGTDVDIKVSIPLEQGNVFRQFLVSYSTVKTYVSIPLEQGNVFRPFYVSLLLSDLGLNPFGTGQCLSTLRIIASIASQRVSIPLEQGNVFRQSYSIHFECFNLSQSLWNRAMSFDENSIHNYRKPVKSQSLWNRAMSFDCVTVNSEMGIGRLNPFGTGQCLSTI